MAPAELKDARKRLGLTQQAIADALEVTLRTVQMWEGGTRAVPGPARVALRLMLQAPRQKSRASLPGQ